MTIENTIQNKEKFMCQYFGQRVYRKDNFIGCLEYVGSAIFGNTFFDGFIELKPLSMISDEDAVEVAKLGYNSENYSGDLEKWVSIPETGMGWISSNQAGCSFTKLYITVRIIDFLRSKGYALPWLGISVEQQIEFGWIKLTQ